MKLDQLTKSQFQTLRTISLASARENRKYVPVTHLRGTNAASIRVLLNLGLLTGGSGEKGFRLTANGRRAETSWLKSRHDTEVEFVCSRCRKLTPADDGGVCGEIDPNGDFCSQCFVDEAGNIRSAHV